MAYYNRESAERMIKARIDGIAETIPVFDKVIEVIKTFDGKVLNKRLETALKTKVSKNIWAKTNSNGVYEITYYTERRITAIDNFDLLRIWSSDLRNYLNDERICADKFIEELEKTKASLVKEREELINGLPKIDEWILKQRELADALNNLRGEIPYAIKDYVYDLKSPTIY